MTKLRRLLYDAATYPPTMVIAARLHLMECKPEDFGNLCKFPKYKVVPQKTKQEVLSYLKNFSTKRKVVDSRLKALADKLDMEEIE